jgi:hypothetical protein
MSTAGSKPSLTDQPAIAGHCQYFTLSPRPSIESPRSSRKKMSKKVVERSDENADHNISSDAQARGSVKDSILEARRVLASARNPLKNSPAKLEARQATPQKMRKAIDAASTPGQRSARSVPLNSLPMTPDSRAEDVDEMSASVLSMSMYSETSHMSRLTQLSRKSFSSKKLLSSKEIEALQVEEKRRQVSELIRKNQVNCRKALLATDLLSAGRVQSDMRLTTPKEFALSCPPTPRSPRALSVAGSDVSETPTTWMRSLRPSSSCQSLHGDDVRRSPSPLQRWKPQLTVPKGPELQTSRRVSLGIRRALSPDEESVNESTGASVNGRPTRAATPEKRRSEVIAAAAAAERQAAAAARAAKAASASSSKLQASNSSKVTRHERAEQARLMAQKRKEEEAQAKQAKMFVFKRSDSADKLASASVSSISQKQPDKTPRRACFDVNTGAGAVSSPAQSYRSIRSTCPAVVTRRSSFGSATPRPCCS